MTLFPRRRKSSGYDRYFLGLYDRRTGQPVYSCPRGRGAREWLRRWFW